VNAILFFCRYLLKLFKLVALPFVNDQVVKVSICNGKKQIQQYLKEVKAGSSGSCWNVLEKDKLVSIPLVNNRVQLGRSSTLSVSNNKVMLITDFKVLDIASAVSFSGLVEFSS